MQLLIKWKDRWEQKVCYSTWTGGKWQSSDFRSGGCQVKMCSGLHMWTEEQEEEGGGNSWEEPLSQLYEAETVITVISYLWLGNNWSQSRSNLEDAIL